MGQPGIQISVFKELHMAQSKAISSLGPADCAVNPGRAFQDPGLPPMGIEVSLLAGQPEKHLG